ncbi:hypothetical protein DFH28DRAFT_958925, partial [Melampsora americana]
MSLFNSLIYIYISIFHFIQAGLSLSLTFLISLFTLAFSLIGFHSLFSIIKSCKKKILYPNPIHIGFVSFRFFSFFLLLPFNSIHKSLFNYKSSINRKKINFFYHYYYFKSFSFFSLYVRSLNSKISIP